MKVEIKQIESKENLQRFGNKFFTEEQVEAMREDDDCEHIDIEWGDDDERGVCRDCGAQCDWHYEKEVIDNYPDSIKEFEVRVPHEWHEAV